MLLQIFINIAVENSIYIYVILQRRNKDEKSSQKVSPDAELIDSDPIHLKEK